MQGRFPLFRDCRGFVRRSRATWNLELVGKDRLEGEVSGAYSARETWVRVEPETAR